MTTVAKKPRKKKSVEDELREKLWATFEDLDQDNSGTLTIDELIAMCKSMNVEVGAWKLRDLLKEVDLDGSGDITFDEFVTALGGHLMRGGDAQQSALGSIFAATGMRPYMLTKSGDDCHAASSLKVFVETLSMHSAR